MHSLRYYLKNPIAFIDGCISIFPQIIPAKIFIKIAFKSRIGFRPNLKNPKSFNEKLQWLKLYDHNPRYSSLVDKYLVKEIIAKEIGKEYIIPTLGVRDKFDDIDFNKLPNQFVLKCNHDSGSIIIVKDKGNLDKIAAKNKLDKALKKNYYHLGKEWVYKNIKPKIIAEKYMVDESGVELKDYKVFCFNGEPKAIQVDFGRFKEHKRNIYNLEWEILPFELQFSSDKNHIIKKPKCLNKIIEFSKKLGKGIPQVRIDYYIIEGKPYFGEMTFYHGAGFETFRPKEYDYLFGEYIKLPNK